MEEELRCAACLSLFSEPVLLACWHALCLKCAKSLQKPIAALLLEVTTHDTDGGDSDKGSVYSETDSGVVIASRPQSYICSPENEGGSDPQLGIKCPTCFKIVSLGPVGASALPRYTAMTKIISRVKGGDGAGVPTPSGVTFPPCQLCEGPPRPATTECLQCQVLYCSQCLVSCHPSRGPLASHSLGPVAPLGGFTGIMSEVCLAHGERPSLYCMLCRWSGCRECGPSHSQHDLQPVETLSKTHKAELSESLQQLSERAKAAHAHITNLKTFQDRVNAHCDVLAAELDRQCNELKNSLDQAKARLLGQLATERDRITQLYRDQSGNCTRKLHQTTGLVQFCIQVIKETDSSAFLQMGPQLIGRVSDLDLRWEKELNNVDTRLSPYIDLDLDNKSVLRAINGFNFIQMKPPSPPEFHIEECVGENNSVTAVWSPHPTSRVTSYALEIDDGDGEFKEVYRGGETVCTIEELQFNTVYHLRVRAINSTGSSQFSAPVAIRTSSVAWFSLERTFSHPECKFSNNRMAMSCESYEHRVALASVGFSRGRHYWQFSVDAYDANADVVFGVARLGVNKEIMLGNDSLGWAMYIDRKRSWFLHEAAHHGRSDGGIDVGSTVGVLLDLNQGTLAFYVNDEQQGDVAFPDMHGLLYPAVSVNRNVTVTLRTSLDPPHSDYDSQSDT